MTRRSSCTHRRIEFQPPDFILSLELWPIHRPEKNKSNQNYSSGITKKRQRPNAFKRAIQSTGWNIQLESFKIERASQKCHFFRNHFTFMESSFGNISWWVANWVFSTVFTKFTLNRKRRYFYEFGVKKLVFSRFCENLGEDRDGKKIEIACTVRAFF